jgi:phage terminase large subunit
MKHTSSLVLYPKQKDIWLEMMCDSYGKNGKPVNTILGYGGARGGSKSWTGGNFIFMRRFIFPHSKALIFRATLGELMRTLIDPILETHPWLEQHFTNTQTVKKFDLPGGSSVYLGYGETYADVKKWRGAAFDDIFVDEVTELPENHIKFLLSCNRRSSNRSKQIVSKAFFAGNPGGLGHSYFQRVFIERDNYMPKENPRAFRFIQSHLWDNYHWIEGVPGIPQVSRHEYYSWKEEKRKAFCLKYAPYVDTLGNLDEYEWKAAVEGDWSSFEGQFFGRFNHQIHSCKEFHIPADWKIMAGLDWGNTTAIEIIAQSPDSDVYFIDEFFVDEFDVGVTERVRRVKDFLASNGRMNVPIAADMDLWYKDTGNTRMRPVEEFYRQGISNIQKVIKAKVENVNYRKIANDKMKELIYWKKGDDGEFIVRPKLHVFEGKCPHLMRTIPLLMVDAAHPGDFLRDPKTKQDHCYDAAKYAVMNIALPAPEGRKVPFYEYVSPNASVSPTTNYSMNNQYARFN